jgi:hypothetical protein
MLKINNIFFGILTGLVISAVAFVIFYYLNIWISSLFLSTPFFGESLVVIFALAVNIIPLQYYLKRNAYYTARGILIYTFVIAAAFTWRYIV